MHSARGWVAVVFGAGVAVVDGQLHAFAAGPGGVTTLFAVADVGVCARRAGG
jgi:hypothetical protein